MLWRLEKMLCRKQDAVIAVSKSVWEDYNKQINYKGQHYILYSFIPEDRFFLSIQKERLVSRFLKCVAIGHFKPAKNYSYLLNNFKMLDGQDIFFWIYTGKAH